MPDGQRNRESAAGAKRAVCGDGSTKHKGEASADLQAKTVSAEAADSGRICLAERLEESADLLGLDADAGVHDRDAKARCLIVPASNATICTVPDSVKFTAFPARFIRIWRSRTKSLAIERGTGVGYRFVSIRFLPAALTRSNETTSAMICAGSTAIRSAVIFPA